MPFGSLAARATVVVLGAAFGVRRGARDRRLGVGRSERRGMESHVRSCESAVRKPIGRDAGRPQVARIRPFPLVNSRGGGCTRRVRPG